MDDLNKRAANALGWEFKKWDSDPTQFIIHNPEKGYDFHQNNLEFSTSYDWAYLLLKKCFHLGKSKEAYARIAYNGMMEAGFSGRSEPPQPEIATPAQITFACIEVLEGLC